MNIPLLNILLIIFLETAVRLLFVNLIKQETNEQFDNNTKYKRLYDLNNFLKNFLKSKLNAYIGLSFDGGAVFAWLHAH